MKSVFRKYQNIRNPYKKNSSIRDELNTLNKKQLYEQYHKTATLENKSIVLDILDNKYNERHQIMPKTFKIIKYNPEDNKLIKRLK
jgi:hypothetical protein